MDEQKILEAQNTRLMKFLDIYGRLHAKGLTEAQVKAAMKKVGPPTLNIVGSLNFLKYLEQVAAQAEGGSKKPKPVGFLT